MRWNMNYYLMIVQNNNICACYKYDNYDSALSAFYTELATRGSGRTETLCLIVAEDGSVRKLEHWKKDGEEE